MVNYVQRWGIITYQLVLTCHDVINALPFVSAFPHPPRPAGLDLAGNPWVFFIPVPCIPLPARRLFKAAKERKKQTCKPHCHPSKAERRKFIESLQKINSDERPWIRCDDEGEVVAGFHPEARRKRREKKGKKKKKRKY